MEGWRIKLLCDGGSPICRFEIRWLSRWDRKHTLALEDISSAGFDPSRYALTQQEVMDRFHAVLPDGTVLRGVPVIRHAYQAVGLGWLVAPTEWPVLRQIVVALYEVFARYRVRFDRFLRRAHSRPCVQHPPS